MKKLDEEFILNNNELVLKGVLKKILTCLKKKKMK